jgi:ATP-binding cassette subfamily B protein
MCKKLFRPLLKRINPHIAWVIRQWYTQRWFLILMILFTLGNSVVGVAFPMLYRKLIDTLKDILSDPNYPQPMMAINNIIYTFLALGVAQIVNGFYPAFRGWINIRFEHYLRMKYFTAITDKDYRFFQKYRTGDIVTRLTDDLSNYPRITWFLCSGIFRAVDSGSLILFSLIVMFSINVKLTLFSIAPLPLMMLAFYFTQDKLYTLFNRNQEAISDINSQLEMSFSGIRIVKAFVSEEKYQRFFDNVLAKRFKTEMSVVKLDAVLDLIYHYIDYIAQIGVILVGGYMAVKGEISVGTFYLFYSYLSMMIFPLIDLPRLFNTGKQAFVNIDRLEDMRTFPTMYARQQGTVELQHFESLRFKDVNFAYDDSNMNVLNGCDLNLEAGKKLLILGSTGSGKSTLINLILGLLEKDSGEILINDIPLEEVHIPSLREALAYVPQEAVLFGGTIKENICFTVDSVDEAEYDLAVKSAQLKGEIADFPEGDQTVVGSRGLGISGGQKQRVTIARALIKRPELLILDDITASLDAENEEKLWQDINANYAGIAAIVISHRLSTLHYVDQILFIDSEGKCHQGTHEELVFQNKEYHDFLHEHLKK